MGWNTCYGDGGPGYKAEWDEELAEKDALKYANPAPVCLGCGSRGCDNPNCGPLDRDE